ncbi:sugar transferase [Tetragenococcus koreensis]|uniref:sugar transferase n=1 Tax=Tetragenococcus koreensis TaxID=290335 RepID=UPI001F3731A3|nr:sugar transferase [Tetragenococcus koreensis]MCF1613592.1 sugar transferase [Tetragenococcus koreensis]MCF1623412.1 sugar transferase [Tetragenococcus koreensis]
MKQIRLFIKRIFDFFGSLIGIIILLPLLLIISIIIKINSRGPVFFKQKRLGKNGKVFNIFKFRTMVTDAEKKGDGIFVKNENDNRITSVGKILRSASLDELPQLLNVIKGDMSLIGPRPPLPYHPYEYEEYPSVQKERFKMRPGVTGLAQVKVRNSVPWDKRMTFDVEYVNNFSIWLDFKIILLTIRSILFKESIYTN